jgi:uncharacterized protein YceK
MRILVLVAFAAVGMAGCATIVKGTTQTVSLDTPGAMGAKCELSSEGIGTQTVVTPATFVLEKSQHSVSVSCRKHCFQDGVGVIASYTEGMAAGNVVLGGVIGLGVDAATGAMNKYADRTSITMIPMQNCRV